PRGAAAADRVLAHRPRVRPHARWHPQAALALGDLRDPRGPPAGLADAVDRQPPRGHRLPSDGQFLEPARDDRAAPSPLLPSRVAAMTALTLALGASDSGWHYAAWVSVDLRLLVFVILIAALAAAGVSAILVRGRHVRDHLAVFVLAFAGIFALALL